MRRPRQFVVAVVAMATGCGSSRDVPSDAGGDAIRGETLGSDAQIDGSPRCTQAGELDPSFGIGGIAAAPFTTGYAGIEDLAVDTGGRIVAVGEAVFGEREEAFVARYLVDGTLDPTFAQTGIAWLPRAGRFTSFIGVALQADGAIVAVGGDQADDGSQGPLETLVARYTPDGVLDSSFGISGLAVANTRWESGAIRATIDASGRIVASIVTDDGRDPQDASYISAVRFTKDGVLDTSFGDAGFAPPQFPGFTYAADVAIDPAGHILVAGSRATLADDDSEMVVVRYDDEGALDTTYAPATQFEESIGGGSMLFDDGSVTLAGGGAAGALARFTPEGTLDPLFAGGGEELVSFGGFSGIAGVPGGFVTSGATGAGTTTRALVARFDDGGALDPSFGSGGFVETGDATLSISAAAIAAQASGKIIVGGSMIHGFVQDLFLARYCP